MILGVNASNIRHGGGVTHLVELLRAADPAAHGFDRVVVWSVPGTLARIEDRSWLRKEGGDDLGGSLASRLAWQRLRLAGLARRAGCDVLLAPGGSDASGFRPIVAMSQNLLPFEWRELARFGPSAMTAKLAILRLAQGRTLSRADGVVFLTAYARRAVERVTGPIRGRAAVIPHGIDERFFRAPRPQRPASAFDAAAPCRILYVSNVYPYKHQWNVVEAAARLRAEGLAVSLELVGPLAGSVDRLREAVRRHDPEGRFVTVRGEVSRDDLPAIYASAEVNVFASSCENLPIILLEGMAAGLPTACSDRGPMPEVLGAAGIYFDPEDPADVARALRELVLSPELRAEKARQAHERARVYSWRRCADETFAFLAGVCEEARS